MKKNILTLMAAILLCVGLTACSGGNADNKVSLNNDIDTASYAIGMVQTQGLREYLVEKLNVDTAYMEEFVMGLTEGAEAGENKQKAAYFAGIQIGQQISNQMIKGVNKELFGEDSTKTISMKDFLNGFISGVTNQNGLMSLEQAQAIAQQRIEGIKTESAGTSKTAGDPETVARQIIERAMARDTPGLGELMTGTSKEIEGASNLLMIAFSEVKGYNITKCEINGDRARVRFIVKFKHDTEKDKMDLVKTADGSWKLVAGENNSINVM